MSGWSLAHRSSGPGEEGIWELVARCYGDRWMSRTRFRHCYFGERAEATRIVTAESGGRVVGMQPVQWVRHRFRGTPIEAGILTGAMVDPEWRQRGIFGALVSECERVSFERGARLVWTMPNERSSPAFRKAGYRFPGERRLYIWAPEPRTLFASRTGGLLGRALGRVASPLLSRRPPRPQGVEVLEAQSLGPEAEALSKNFCSGWSGILQDRDAPWRTWRFGTDMEGPYRFLEARESDGGASAWCVVTRERREGREVGYILDLVAGDRRAGVAVVSEALRLMAGWGVELVMSAVCGRGLGALMSGGGMVRVPRAMAPKRFYLAYRTAPGAEADLTRDLSSPENWYLTFADWDAL